MWHYSRDGQTEGPVSEEVLLALVKQGLVGPNTYIYRDGWTDWKTASAVLPHLFAPAPPPPPPDARPARSAPAAPSAEPVVASQAQESTDPGALGRHLQEHTRNRYLTFGILGLCTFFLPWNTEEGTHFYWDVLGQIPDMWSGMKGFLIFSLFISIACLVVSRLQMRPAIRSVIVAGMAFMGALFFFVAISQSLSNTTRMLLMGDASHTVETVAVAQSVNVAVAETVPEVPRRPEVAARGMENEKNSYKRRYAGASPRDSHKYGRPGPPPGFQRPSFAPTVAFFVFFSFGLVALSFATRLLALQESVRTARILVMGSVVLIGLLWVLPVVPYLGESEAPRTMMGLTFALFEHADSFDDMPIVAVLSGLYLFAILPLVGLAWFGFQKNSNPTFLRVLSYAYTAYGPFIFVPVGMYLLMKGSFGGCFFLAFYLYMISELMVDGLLAITQLARKS